MAPDVMIRADGLRKLYGRVVALEELSLSVSRGEILALVGHNGAGKTTALRLLVGLLRPTAGRVEIGGHDVQQEPLAVKRITAFLPDQPFLYEQLTVAETIGFIGGIYALPEVKLRAAAEELLALFELRPVLGRRVGQLSYGMRSRLALLISLLHEPHALIMDEPFFGLDPRSLRVIKTFLAERARRGMAILLSTHQLSVVEDVAHRIAVIGQGRLLACGTLAELRRMHGEGHLEELFFHITG